MMLHALLVTFAASQLAESCSGGDCEEAGLNLLQKKAAMHTQGRQMPTMMPPSGEMPTMMPPSGEMPTMMPPSGEMPTMMPPSGDGGGMCGTFTCGPDEVSECPPCMPASGEMPTMMPTSGEMPTMMPPSGEMPTMMPPSGEMPTMMPPKKTSVIIMRHCVRTPGNDGIRAKPGFHTVDDYASGKFPVFDAAANFCTPEGSKLVETQGKWTKAHNGIPLPVRAIGDHVARCRSTMDNFLKGFSPGLTKEQLSVKLDRLPFRWGKSPACEAKKLSDADALKAQQDYIDANPVPADYHSALKHLYELLGKGAAGDWTNIPCTAGLGYGPSYPDPKVNRGIAMQPVGACQAATHLISQLGTESANGMEIAWNRLNGSSLHKFGILCAYHDHVWFTNPTAAAWRAAALTRDVSDKLSEAEPGTTMYFGRKSNILELAGVMGLSWPTNPFNVTKTGSWLRFDREGDTITASYEFPLHNEVGSNGAMTSVPVFFTKTGTNTISFEEYKKIGEDNTIAECAHGNECPNLPGCWKNKDGTESDDDLDPEGDDE